MSTDDAALLVVDDNEDNRYTLTRRLKRQGYTNLTTANDGQQALELLRARRFDLMLLDIMMPALNGYQVLEQLKASPELRHVPVIMISALEEMESVVRCIELGAEDYLPKPFDATLLRARVGATLEKKRLRDEIRASLHRLEQELDAARALQLGMLPSIFPACSPRRPVEVHAWMEPAREVGGDLYDFFYASDNTFCFLVGDVSGKGAPAAMFMARTRSLVRMAIELWGQLAAESLSPGRIAEAVNRELRQNNAERMFVTLFLGLLDTRSGTLAYVNAGHPGPRILRAAGEIERIQARPDAPLGTRRDAVYRNHSLTLQPGDVLFVCSDGVAETENADQSLYTDRRLDEDLSAIGAASPADMIRNVKERLDAFAGDAPKADDVTMLALRWQPARAAGAQTTQLVIRNDMAELARVTQALERIGAEHAIAANPLMQLQVVLDELLSNVIKYAWPQPGAHEIRVGITPGPGEVRVELADDGRMFNPLEAPEPARPGPGERPRPGGLGIHLVRQLVDKIEYERVGEQNRLTLVKRCAAGAPSQ